MLTKQISHASGSHTGGLGWARELMTAAGVSQKDVARSWEVSESSVSRWLDGLQSTDLSLHRAVIFSHLVRRSLEEIAARLGHDVWRSDGVPRVQPLTSPGKPPVPTTSLEPGSREGMFFLLLHLELTAANVAAIIATLDKGPPPVNGAVHSAAAEGVGPAPPQQPGDLQGSHRRCRTARSLRKAI